MYADMFPDETASALADRVRNPVPRPPRAPSIWSAVGDLLSAPFEGAAQGVNESLRVAAKIATARAEPDPVDRKRAGLLPWTDAPASIVRERAKSELLNGDIAAGADEALRNGANFWRPDAATGNWATQFLHESGRILAKVGGYSVAAGVPGAVVGAGIDEGLTSYAGLRDRGVDKGTAGQVAAVHAGMTALTIAAPVAGRTALQTAGLVLGTGPGSFMAESELSRRILESAAYPELSAEFDPFDPAGLALSLVPGAAIGVAVHRSRAHAAARAELPAMGERPAGEATAHSEASPELPVEAVEAAHVVYQRDAVDSGMLGRTDDPMARSAHAQALEEARLAMDEGRPIQLPELHLDESRASAAAHEIAGRLRAADAPRAIEAQRAVDSGQMGFEPIPAVRDQSAGSAHAATSLESPARAEAAALPDSPQRQQVQRALEIARERPELPVRLDDDGGPARPAGEVIRAEALRAGQEASESTRAIQAAIECFLKVGTE